MTKSSGTTALIGKFAQIVKTFFLLLIPTTLLWNCISPPDFLGGDLLPDDDFTHVTTDTSFSVSAYTVAFDSIFTNNFTDAVLGETWDAVFGKSTASFLTQLRLNQLNTTYGADPVIDSAFLYLKLLDKHGNEPLRFAVYELIDTLSADSSYNALASVEHLYNSLEEPAGKTEIDYTGEENILKIPMNLDWVMNRLVIPSMEDSIINFNQDSFVNFFHGIYVKPLTSLPSYGKGMYYFDYSSEDSKMAVYFRDLENEDDSTTRKYEYAFLTGNTRFNKFSNDLDFADPNLKVKFNYPAEDLVQDSVFYLKGLGVAKGVLLFDDIIQWADSMPVAIHRAELRLELEEHEQIPKDSLTKQLFLYQMKDGKRVGLIDYSINSEVFDGNYKKPYKYYSFNITHHIQALLKKDDPDISVYIEPSQSYIRAHSAILRTGNHSSRIKLILTYTKL